MVDDPVEAQCTPDSLIVIGTADTSVSCHSIPYFAVCDDTFRCPLLAYDLLAYEPPVSSVANPVSASVTDVDPVPIELWVFVVDIFRSNPFQL